MRIIPVATTNNYYVSNNNKTKNNTPTFQCLRFFRSKSKFQYVTTNSRGLTMEDFIKRVKDCHLSNTSYREGDHIGGASADAIYHFDNESAKKFFRSPVSAYSNPNEYNYHGDTTLTAACRYADKELFDLVMADSRIDVNKREHEKEDDRYDPPLNVVMHGENPKVADCIIHKIKTLLDKGADVNAGDQYNNTLAMLASGAGRIGRYYGSGIVYLVPEGCCGWNADLRGIGNEVLRMLAERDDVKFDTKNKAGQSALDIAKMTGNEEGVKIITGKLNK